MNLLGIVNKYDKDDAADRALFESAMEKHIAEHGFRMADLMYQLYQCQHDIQQLREEVEGACREGDQGDQQLHTRIDEVEEYVRGFSAKKHNPKPKQKQ